MDVYSLLELFPLILTLVLALWLRHTLIALGAGVLCGALIVGDFAPLPSLEFLLRAAAELVYRDGSWRLWNINVILAMVLLGAMTAVLARSGVVADFGRALALRLRDARQARLGIVGLGFLVFIDGIFSCLAVGNVGRPIAGRYGISPPRLAYLVDTTASPLCSLVPVASWGPYVMTLLAALSFLPVTPFEAFVSIASMNFYAIASLVLVLVGTWLNWGWRFDETAVTDLASSAEADSSAGPARLWPLLVPLLGLLISALLLMLYSGMQLATKPGIAAALMAADIGSAMRYAAAIALLLALGVSVFHGRGTKVLADLVVGVKGMGFALAVLLLTWMMGAVIQALGSAELIAGYARELLSPSLLLAGVFVLCAIMAFVTGTSWGTFAIMIPLCTAVAHALAPELLLGAIAAVMAGSVFGDHCSPISDTSVLSASASGCTVHDHVVTQLPFALMAAASALLGFGLMNLGVSQWPSLLLCLLFAMLLLKLFDWRQQRSMALLSG
ncbi:sodium:proton antiporter [Shewanella sp. JM162201]|uniref:Sodium:proton antiporter n=1 Tax=Shewanella jiangmenensis TaxID=2837387 RepID=A0ABS5V4I8_9GAMM|nr:Na+/H+ antiporter NhaC family protein [Shewanella jiangmenensis]MBT1445379.1 sodium:proton antiporter [Shewanella jiangmenensis]